MSPKREIASESARAVHLGVAGMTATVTFGPGLEELAEEMAALWSHAASSGTSDSPDITLDYVLEGTCVPAGATPMALRQTAAYTVSGNITRRVIQKLLGARLLLHAGAVELPGLGTVVVVGPSGAGKSTAITRLGRAGRYLSDELTILDPQEFAVTAYPKPVSMRVPGSRAKRDVALREVDLQPAWDGAAPSMVVLLERERSGEALRTSDPSVRRLPLAEALIHLIPQTSSLWRVPDGLSRLATLLTSTGGALAVRYREAEELAGLLGDAPAPSAETFTPIPRAEQQLDLPAGMYGVAPYAHALALESGIFVLTEREGVYLPGIAGIAWDALRRHGCLAPDGLERQIIHELGEHPQSSRFVRAALGDLVSRGLVRHGPMTSR